MEDTVIAALKHDILLPVVTQTIYNPNTLGKVLPDPFYERYRICERLGEGSYGEVLKALQLATGQEVAVKILRMRQDSDAPPAASQITRFRREMQLCARLHHPNIVRLIDFDSVADILYIVFEFIPGKTLAEVLRAETRLDFAETIHLLGQVLDALHCAHNQGVVHRDLKPENIMITDTGARRNAMVLDFGVAAFIDSDTPKSNAGSYPVTLSGEILGSPAYAAPEQLRGEQVTTRADLYAWGLIAIECLDGERVIPSGSLEEILYRQLGPEPVTMSDLIRRHPIGRILERATAKKVDERDVTARDVLKELDALAGDIGQRRRLVSSRIPRMLPVHHTGLIGDAAVSVSPFTRQDLETPGERRQLTAVCCHLSISREPADRPLDPEEFEQLLRAKRHLCIQAARAFNGYVASLLGDHVMLYFGYPQASEDEAARAAQTALEIIHNVQRRNAELQAKHAISVQVQIGIHSGLVIVREYHDAAGHALYDVIGRTPEIAARLEHRAEYGTVLVSGVMQKKLKDQFILEPAGCCRLAELARPLEAYRLLREHAPGQESKLTPLVARAQELALLLQSWQRAQQHNGQSVLIIGEAGIGKSRLAREFQLKLQSAGQVLLKCRCAAENQSKTLRPVAELLEQVLQPFGDDRLTALETLLRTLGLEPQESVPLLADLLDVSLQNRYLPLNVSPERQKELLFNTLLSALFALAEQQPLALIIEDLHWADPSTLELLAALVKDIAAESLCAVFTARPEFEPQWAAGDFVQLRLDRLNDAATRAMVLAITSGKPLPDEVMTMIVQRTDGVSLYVEELTYMLLDTGKLAKHDDHYELKQPASESLIPATLLDLLTAKLDKLGRAKETAQLAAAIGREFPYDLLAALSPFDRLSLDQDLETLQQANLVFRRRRQQSYLFKHALIRDAAYESILQDVRQEIHKQIALTLEQSFAGLIETRPDLLAHHHAAAGQKRHALIYAQKAGLMALQRSAYTETIEHANRALSWLDTIEDDNARNETELTLNSMLTPALMASKGFGAPELAEINHRSLELIDRLGDAPQVFPVLRALVMYHSTRADFQQAIKLAQRYVDMAEDMADPGQLISGLSMLGAYLYVSGNFQEAESVLSRAIMLHNPAIHRDLAYRFGVDPLVTARSNLSQALLPMGYPDKALEQTQLAIEYAKSLNHATTLGLAYLFAMIVHQQRQEKKEIIDLGQYANEHCHRYGLVLINFYCQTVYNWALGNIEPSRQMIAHHEKIHSLFGLTYYRSLVAENLADQGEHLEAIELFDKCISDAERLGERFHLSRLYQLKGQTLLLQGHTHHNDAGRCFTLAIETARTQKAPMLELFAVYSLAELWKKTNRSEEAEKLLTDICSQVPEQSTISILLDTKNLLKQFHK